MRTGAKRTEQRLGELVSPVVKALGYSLWGLECKGRGASSTVRLFIDTHPTGGNVTMADIERVSRQVSMLFDLEDPIQGSYQLEVSSPGIERRFFTIEQCQEYVGEFTQLKLRVPLDGRRTFNGKLAEVDAGAGTVTLDEDGDRHRFRFDEVRDMNLVWQA